MRRAAAFLFLILGCCQHAYADGLTLSVHRQGNYLLADMSSNERACIVTYKIYYNRFGFIPVYGKRLGIDIQGECEINVPVGKSTAKFNIDDDYFKSFNDEKNLCVDVTYYVYRRNSEVSLRHKRACE